MTDATSISDLRALLVDLYWAAVRAAAPGPAVRAALEELGAVERRVWILALGKAAVPMASAAVQLLHERGISPAGGLVIAPAASDLPGAVSEAARARGAEAAAESEAPPPALEPPHPALEVVPGDHPEPGPRSFEAARRLAQIAARVEPQDEAWVLLSGGATSLAAGPVEGIPPRDLAELYRLLLRSGLEIAAMNAVRKRFSRWGGGRLAAALAPARVRTYIVSDVVGDDLPSIGSGPCVPDERTAAEVRSLLTSAALWERIPEAMRRSLAAAERDRALETPKPGDPLFVNVETRLVASNRRALAAAAARARALGVRPTVMDDPLTGEAAETGQKVGRTLLRYCQEGGSQPAVPRCLIWGGETTVTLGAGPTGRGGRCQELALAAARVLAEWSGPGRAALLAAGTDGRDGPTDAAGAVVDEGTWESIRGQGRRPDSDLARHDSYAALDAAGALLRTGLTGTNVMDLVFGLCT